MNTFLADDLFCILAPSFLTRHEGYEKGGASGVPSITRRLPLLIENRDRYLHLSIETETLALSKDHTIECFPGPPTTAIWILLGESKMGISVSSL